MATPSMHPAVEAFLDDCDETCKGRAPQYSIGSFWLDCMLMFQSKETMFDIPDKLWTLLKIRPLTDNFGWGDFIEIAIKAGVTPLAFYGALITLECFLAVELVARLRAKLIASRRAGTRRPVHPVILGVFEKWKYRMDEIDMRKVESLGITQENHDKFYSADLQRLELVLSPVEIRELYQDIQTAFQTNK